MCCFHLGLYLNNIKLGLGGCVVSVMEELPIQLDQFFVLCLFVIEPRYAYAKTKTQISFVVTAQLISAFVFAT